VCFLAGALLLLAERTEEDNRTVTTLDATPRS
jgi:hypothetical protein